MATLTDYLVLRDSASRSTPHSTASAGSSLARRRLHRRHCAGETSRRLHRQPAVGRRTNGRRRCSDPGGAEGFFEKLDVVSTLGFGVIQRATAVCGRRSRALLTPGARNAVTFRALEGWLRLRDVVLWHQRAA